MISVSDTNILHDEGELHAELTFSAFKFQKTLFPSLIEDSSLKLKVNFTVFDMADKVLAYVVLG